MRCGEVVGRAARFELAVVEGRVFGVFALLFLSWLGNAGLMVAVVTLSKDLKVEGGSLKNNKDGGAISTVSQKKVYEVTLLPLPSRRQLGGQSTAGDESSTVVEKCLVCKLTCALVMEAISSIEEGKDGSLAKINLVGTASSGSHP